MCANHAHFKDLLRASPDSFRVVILTGAGISAESGVDTFRDANGIWSKVDYRDVATPQGFFRDPDLVHDFYNARRDGMAGVRPNAAHAALAWLEEALGDRLLLVTQNIDDLHERAGSRRLVHMHGELASAWCTRCGTRHPWHAELTSGTACPTCRAAGFLRPDVVWFGEMPYRMDEIDAALGACDLFVSIGTSGNVYPAAGFVEQARHGGAYALELNLEPSEGRSFFTEARHGRATQIVPEFVDELLGG